MTIPAQTKSNHFKVYGTKSIMSIVNKELSIKISLSTIGKLLTTIPPTSIKDGRRMYSEDQLKKIIEIMRQRQMKKKPKEI